MTRHNSHRKIISTKKLEEVYLELHKNYPEKYGFFICELHFGDSDVNYKLCTTTDVKGPFGLLSKARKLFNKKYLNTGITQYAIRGPWHTSDRGSKTQFYSHKED